MKCSNRISGMQESPIRKLVPYANAARANGKKVYPLNIGQPDIKTPEGYFDAIKNFKQEVLEYADSHGDFTLMRSASIMRATTWTSLQKISLSPTVVLKL